MTATVARAAAAKAEARKPAPQRAAAVTQGIEGAAIGNLLEQLRAGGLRPNLMVGGTADPEEREADRFADTLMGGTRAPCACGGTCATCSGGNGGMIRRKAEGGGDSPTAVSQAFRGPGRNLDLASRARFEPRSGLDLSAVLIHDDAGTATIARSIGARAYTIGNNIGFAQGAYQPGSTAGQHLLAHELGHVALGHGGVRRGGAGDAMILARNREVEEKRQRVEALNRQLRGANSPPANSGQGSANGVRQYQDNAGPTNAGNREIGPPAPPAPGQTTEFRGTMLYPDPIYIYGLLSDMVIAEGSSAAADFVESFYLDVILPKRPAAGISEDPNVWRDEAVYSVLNEQSAKLSSDISAFVAQFEAEARAAAQDFLTENEKHVRAEAIAYGVTFDVRMSDDGASEIGGDTTENASTRGLAIAAQGLLDRKRKADRALSEYEDYTHGMSAYAELVRQRQPIGESSGLDEKRKLLDDTQRDLEVNRAQVELKFLILAALASDSDFKWDELGDLAKGKNAKNSDATKVIVDQIVQKLENIQKVREELQPGGDVNIWLVPQIVEPLRETLAAASGSLHGKVVGEKIEDEKPSLITGILIGLAQLGLVLLAPVTGGLTLIPAAAIGVGTAYAHIKEYQLKNAMHGTDFGAAALSAEEPSLFWLAVDIIGAGLDVTAAGGAALKMFRQIGPLAKALRGARTAEEAVALEKQVAQVGGEMLAKRVGQSAKNLRDGVVGELGVTADEALQFEQAAGDIAAQVAEDTAAGQIRVSRAGGIFGCSSPCTMLREKFKDILVNEPELLQDLTKLEERASKLPKGVEGDLGRKAIADEARVLADKLHNARLIAEEASPAAIAVGQTLDDAVRQAVPKLGKVRIDAARQALKGFPKLSQLGDDAIERIVRAGLAVGEDGALRTSKVWRSATRGQLLEELAAVRVRDLLKSGRASELGLKGGLDNLTFIEGSRIRDASGALFTDGMIVRRTGAKVEIVAVIESKAGEWSASKLGEGLQGLKRMPANDLIEGVRTGGKWEKLAKIDPGLAKFRDISELDKLNQVARAEVRDKLEAAIRNLAPEDLKPLKAMMQTTEGQVSLDVERLMGSEDRSLQIMLKDADGTMSAVTTEVPTRPRFLGAVPEGVDIGGMSKTLRQSGFDFSPLPLEGLGMTKPELDAVSKALFEKLGGELSSALNAGAH